MTVLRLGVVQHDIAWEDAGSTRRALEPWVSAAAAAGARVVVLSEMFATGFSMNTDITAESPGGPTETWLVAQAAKHSVWIAGSLAERDGASALPSNTMLLVSPGGDVHRYRKLHPFSYGAESDHFAPGDKVISVDIDGVRVTPFICYDLRFATVFWDAAHDTDLYLVVANWPQTRRRHWIALLEARAIENQAYVAGCNRVGSGGGLDYLGDSRVVDPMGEVLASAAGGESLLIADVDTGVVAQTRQTFPFLADRRP